VTGKILAPKKKKVTGRWKKLHKELHNVYSLPNIIRLIKLRKKMWTGCVAHIYVKF
jgi:hypothetical protein